MQTLKMKYHTNSDDDLMLIKSYQSQYNSVLRFMYNRVCDGLNEKNRESLTKSLNNIDSLDSWFIRSAAKQAQWLYDSVKSIGNNPQKLIFGGKKNLMRRCKGLISKKDFQTKRLQPLQSIGEAIQKGNRKFRLNEDVNMIVFSPDRHTHINLIFDGLSKNYKRLLTKLYKLQETKAIPITYQLSQDYVYIMFNESDLCNINKMKQKKDRVMAIDINPNYIGWSIVDWKSSSEYQVIKHGVYSIKTINDKENELYKQQITSDNPQKEYITNKRKYEVIQISKNLINKAIYYQCDLFSVEDINMKTSDKELGKRYNRLVNNQWCRVKLLQNIEKRCNIFGIKMLKVKPEYSSFIGNIIFRDLRYSDMELSSIEIGRRGYEFRRQYIDKIEKQRNNIIAPDMADFNSIINQSLEELGINAVCENLRELYYLLKKSKIRYRLSLDEISHPMFSRCFSKTSLILKYNN